MKYAYAGLIAIFLSLPAASVELMPWERQPSKEEKEAAAARAAAQVAGFRLEELLFRATLFNKAGEGQALIEIPSGTVVRIGVGTKLGANGGVLSAGRDREIEITEQVPACGTPNLTQRVIVMKMEERLPEGTTVSTEKKGGKYSCKATK